MEFLFLRALRALGMPFACLIIALTVVLPAPVYAGSSSAFITGTVTNGGKPAAHVVVTAAGNNLTVKTTTDGKGHFSFPRSPWARTTSRRAMGTCEVSCAWISEAAART